MKLGQMLLVIGLLFAGSTVWSEEPADPASLGFIKGISWGWVGTRGDYAGPAAPDSLQKVADTGANWVCLRRAGDDDARHAEILFADANPRMVTDDEIRRAIDVANQNGLKVIVKPTVNCGDGVCGRGSSSFVRSRTMSGPAASRAKWIPGASSSKCAKEW